MSAQEAAGERPAKILLTKIGLDGHEWVNLVRGNTTPLARGMCFSDEPMVAIYGEFGIRLEDCFYMTDEGPRLFTRQSPSVEEPFG